MSRAYDMFVITITQLRLAFEIGGDNTIRKPRSVIGNIQEKQAYV